MSYVVESVMLTEVIGKRFYLCLSNNSAAYIRIQRRADACILHKGIWRFVALVLFLACADRPQYLRVLE